MVLPADDYQADNRVGQAKGLCAGGGPVLSAREPSVSGDVSMNLFASIRTLVDDALASLAAEGALPHDLAASFVARGRAAE